MKKPVTREEKDIQVRREARATLILFAICFVWNVVFAYAIPGSIRLGGLPLWWLISTPGMFVIAIIGVKISARSADREHPYGHERFECVAAIVLSMVLFITGLLIGWQGLRKIVSSGETPLAVPGALALGAAVLSILVKEGMYHYTRAAAESKGQSGFPGRYRLGARDGKTTALKIYEDKGIVFMHCFLYFV